MALFNSCPRISFSIDFTDSQHQKSPIEIENTYIEAPVSSEFEFSEFSPVTDETMISADELFFKGRMLPLKENGPKITTTLGDELLANGGDDYKDNVATRLVKGWKERLGLKRSTGRVVRKKGGKNGDGDLGRVDEI
ncbi:hypothetical protein OROMI_028159 [Orobanche minor]